VNCKLVVLTFRVELEDQRVIAMVHVKGVLDGVGLDRLQIERTARQPQHEPVRPPVRRVDMGVKIARHQLQGIAREVAMAVDVLKPLWGDLGPRGDLP
jgi:hypothetical protein